MDVNVAVACPGCSHRFRVKIEDLSRTGKCGHCGLVFRLSENVSFDSDKDSKCPKSRDLAEKREVAGNGIPPAESSTGGMLSQHVASQPPFVERLLRDVLETLTRRDDPIRNCAALLIASLVVILLFTRASIRQHEVTARSVISTNSPATISKERAQQILHQEAIMEALKNDTDPKKVQETLDRIDRSLGIKHEAR